MRGSRAAGRHPRTALQMPNFGATNRNTVYLEKTSGAGGAKDHLDRVQAAADYRRHGHSAGVDAG